MNGDENLSVSVLYPFANACFTLYKANVPDAILFDGHNGSTISNWAGPYSVQQFLSLAKNPLLKK